MSIWRYNQAEDDYEEILPWEQEEPELPEPELPEPEWPEEPNYCATCSYAGRCAGYCSVPPDTMSRYPLRKGRNPFLYLGDDDE